MIDMKLASAFRSFVQKVFLPNIKKTDPCLLEWNKFSNILTNQSASVDEVCHYVQTINSLNSNFTSSFQKRDIPLFKKRKEETQTNPNESAAFNPSKAFGGERARMMFMKNEMEEGGDSRQPPGQFNNWAINRMEDKRNTAVNAQTILPGLQRLSKTFSDNQQRIESLLNTGFKPIAVGKYG